MCTYTIEHYGLGKAFSQGYFMVLLGFRMRVIEARGQKPKNIENL